MMDERNVRIAVVGLGYVGLPLAVAFGRTKFAPIIGFDINSNRIKELRTGHDATDEVPSEALAAANIEFTDDPQRLRSANFIIVAVPTPITKSKTPDLSSVISASKMVGKHLTTGSTVVFESTVYPGVTEEVCRPIIERESRLRCGTDWKIGYSPERINPGDREHTIDKIVKIVSGMDDNTLQAVATVYGIVCHAGVHRAPNIKTAEAAKIIENIQRDLNIALMNECALIFARLGIRTTDVLAAAGTKWNFLKFTPGLVGGHCIGVDPYYLTYRAQVLGYHPEVILAGRRVNDSMGGYVADLMVEKLLDVGISPRGARVALFGLTFKENVRDTRNSKVHDVINRLQRYHVQVLGHDPLLTEKEIAEFDVEPILRPDAVPPVNGIIITSPHRSIRDMGIEQILQCILPGGVIVDIKGVFADRIEPDPSRYTYHAL